MKNYNNRLNGVLFILLIFTLSCSILGKEYSFSELKSRPYVGGSLKFDSNNPSISQLKTGCYYPIQLQKLSKTYLGYYNGVHEYEFDEIPIHTKFGTIKVVDVSSSRITISCQLYDYEGTALYPVSYRLYAGNKVDLNGDGKYDLSYVSSINPNRTSRSGVKYLQFLSPENETHCAMFSYTPDHDFDLSNAGGLLGYNVDGYALVNQETMASATRTRDGVEFTRAENPDLETGDFIYSDDLGQYCRVSSVQHYRNGRSLIRKECSGISVHEVLKIANINTDDFLSDEYLNKLNENTLEESRNISEGYQQLDYDEYQKRISEYKNILKGLRFNFTIPAALTYDIKVNNSTVGEVGLLNCDLMFGMELSCKIKRRKIRIRSQKGYLIDTKIGARTFSKNFDETINLITHEKDITKNFMIGPIPCYVSVGAGFKIDAGVAFEGTDKNIEIGQSFGGMRFKDSEIKLSIRKGVEKNNRRYIKDFFGCTDFNLKEKIKSASFDITPNLHIFAEFGVGWKKLGACIGIESNLSLVAEAGLNVYPQYISIESSLTRNISVGLYSKAKILWWDWKSNWPPFFSDSKVLWYKDWDIVGKPDIKFVVDKESKEVTLPTFQQISFKSINTGGSIDNFHWDFGDGTTSTSSDPQKAYSRPGEFNVKLTVSNSTGSDSYQSKIKVISPISAALMESFLRSSN